MQGFSETEKKEIFEAQELFCDKIVSVSFRAARRRFGLRPEQGLNPEHVPTADAAIQAILIMLVSTCPAVLYKPESFIKEVRSAIVRELLFGELNENNL